MIWRSLVISAASWGLGIAACAWAWWARRRFSREARTLTDEERRVMGEHFEAGILERVRVAEVERVELPLSRVGRVLFRVGFLSGPAGIALGDLVVVSVGKKPSGSESRNTRRTIRDSLLFHELVHVAQYEAMGMRGFLTTYVRGWLENGREYFAIPLESQAYALQERFERGELADGEVERAVRGE